ncbi:hypothetical protein D3C80_1667310 [compost metagenome]
MVICSQLACTSAIIGALLALGRSGLPIENYGIEQSNLSWEVLKLGEKRPCNAMCAYGSSRQSERPLTAVTCGGSGEVLVVWPAETALRHVSGVGGVHCSPLSSDA